MPASEQEHEGTLPAETRGSRRRCANCGAAAADSNGCTACLLALALFKTKTPFPEPQSGDPQQRHEDSGPTESEGFQRISRALALVNIRSLPWEFGAFTLVRPLGAGGMGLVFEAQKNPPPRRVAIKLMRLGAFATPEELARFQTEARSAARLNHPNIIPLYETGVVDGHHFLTMKLLSGGSLADRMATGHRSHPNGLPFLGDAHGYRLAPFDAGRLVSTMAHAVHHAHQRGILHRDLKPSNLLFDDQDVPHLADFGLAMDSGQQRDTGSPVPSQMTFGTPDYMAPEQAAGSTRDLTAATDVWGLGTILYETLTGRKPFAAPSMPEVLDRVRHQEPEVLSRLIPDLDPALAAICMRCLEKAPTARYQSAEDLALDLERYLRRANAG